VEAVKEGPCRGVLAPIRYLGGILRKRRPLQLTFFVTARCNSRCPFCFYLQGMDKEIKGGEELSLDEIRMASASMGSLLWLLYSGGEPYLREDLVEVCQVFYENNRPWIITIPTNALLPGKIEEKTRDILETCGKSVVAVKLSMDALYADHDALRGAKGSFEKLMDTYHRLVPLLEEYPNFELGINTVFCGANQYKIPEVIEYVKDMRGIRTHTISLIRGKLRDEAYKKVDLELYRQVIEEMEAGLKGGISGIYRFPGARLKAAQDIMQRRLIYETMKKKQRLIPCYAGKLNLVLTEEGDVYPCELLKEKMGNIREHGYSIPRLLDSKEAEMVVSRVESGRCYCSHECYFMTNILFNPGTYGKLIREYLSLLI
jgi:radical SAM protein with 4Fe4S-binding SPASM domain